jgi:hypothetical protein
MKDKIDSKGSENVLHNAVGFKKTTTFAKATLPNQAESISIGGYQLVC